MPRIISGGTMLSLGPGALSVTVGSGQWRGGRVANIGSSAQQLISQSVPCSLVWLCAGLGGNGEPANTAVVLVGDSESQNMPLMPNDPAGLWIPVENVNMIYVRAVSGSQSVEWRAV